MLVGAAIVLTVVNPKLALTAAVAMPPIAILTYFFAHRVFPISRQVQRKKGHLTEASDEAVVGIEMVQAFRREDDVRDRFHEGRRPCGTRRCDRRRSRPDSSRASSSYRRAAVLLVGGREAIAGNLTIGEFTLFITCCSSSCGRSRRSAGSSTSVSAQPPPRGASPGSTGSPPL